jgi:hypothetical protein
MTKSPVVIEPTEADETMSPYSRIRLGKSYSIECNVTVRDIGMVVPEHRAVLLRYHQETRDIGWESSSDLDGAHPMNETPVATHVETQTDPSASNTGLKIDSIKPQHVGSAAFEVTQDQSMSFTEVKVPLKAPVAVSERGIIDDDDRRSVQSLESSTTLVSTSSVATLLDKSATVELQRIFQEDVEFVRLYRWALKDTSMGPVRLQRNIARLLHFFAKDLRREASGGLETEASRFVRSKAQYVAHCIVEECNDTPIPLISGKQRDTDGYNKQQDDAYYEFEERQPKANDDLDEVAPVDEDYFEDLAMLRIFLVESSAFQMFRARLNKFVLPKDSHQRDLDLPQDGHPINAPWPRFWQLENSTRRTVKATLVAIGCLEPPLQPGLIRLRWQCVSPLVAEIAARRLQRTRLLMLTPS